MVLHTCVPKSIPDSQIVDAVFGGLETKAQLKRRKKYLNREFSGEVTTPNTALQTDSRRAMGRTTNAYPMPSRKIDFDVVRKIALALPDVEESTIHGAPSLKVRGRLLTCPALHVSRTATCSRRRRQPVIACLNLRTMASSSTRGSMEKLSVDDYFRLPESLRPMELSWGQVREPPAPKYGHQSAVTHLGALLDRHVRERGLGEVCVSPVDVVLDRYA